ncbi:MAG: hypothetical protein NTZ34_12415 [Chloroflexi bacterium]|nr:hypothetical protein [Chloroflexota bacterium]
MDKKTISALQIAGIVLQVIILILVLVLFFNINARMTAIEQKQAVLENRLDVIRSDGLNISH